MARRTSSSTSSSRSHWSGPQVARSFGHRRTCPHRIVNAKSPDGTCEVTISELGSPVSFSPSDIRIKVLWDTDPNVIGAENVTQIETILSNDGKSLDADNFTVTWRDNIPTVITHGEEQHDQSYTFNWKDVPHRFG